MIAAITKAFRTMSNLQHVKRPQLWHHLAGIFAVILVAKGAIGMMIMPAIGIAMPTMSRAMEGNLRTRDAVRAFADVAMFTRINARVPVRMMTDPNVEPACSADVLAPPPGWWELCNGPALAVPATQVIKKADNINGKRCPQTTVVQGMRSPTAMAG